MLNLEFKGFHKHEYLHQNKEIQSQRHAWEPYRINRD